jgi:hypothetical protein
MNDPLDGKYVSYTMKQRALLYGLQDLIADVEFDFFIASLSTKNDCLSQWRCYGDDGRGACIGFEVDRDPDSAFDSAQNDTLTFAECKYELLDRVIKDIDREIIKAREADKNHALARVLCGLAALKAGYYNTITKHSAYTAESEYRFVYVPGKGGFLNASSDGTWREPEYYEGARFLRHSNSTTSSTDQRGFLVGPDGHLMSARNGDRITFDNRELVVGTDVECISPQWRHGRFGYTTYYDFSFEALRIKPVSLMIGPTAAAGDLERYLKEELGYEMEVTPSTAPYRH